MSIVTLAAALLASTAAEPVSVSGAQATPDDPVTCRRFAETGSLVRKTKVCRTASEWRRVEEAARKTSREMVESNTGRPPGN